MIKEIFKNLRQAITTDTEKILAYITEQKIYTEFEQKYWLIKLICPKPLWNFISVYRKSISQSMQDYWIINEVFPGKRNGFFLDIGSTDGVTINNTYILEKRFGWDGICIEPNPYFFNQLIGNRRCTCLNLCVDKEPGKVKFCYYHVLGGIVDKDTDCAWCNDVNFADLPEKLDNPILKSLLKRYGVSIVELDAVPLVDVLDEYRVPRVIDYLSIDVEGAEERILKDFPFDKYTFSAITIERPSDTLHKVFTENDYILVKKLYWGTTEDTWLDNFYIHKSKLSGLRGEYPINIYNCTSEGSAIHDFNSTT